ncbi:erythritol kinase (L-erythritol 4-phosphate-forming) [Sphaerotilus hippei]|uniref:Erythritol kinase (L-erythritol 4-phosphate-forming) n=1 Tax=Sphaerotilus hippei TaxID=744406 RepID=A0A318H908_9BURK|nr:FGGY-family carbohydrate kinase [Sphaerotilus hippei]PXW96557.1 erythritol kinase (L-erythritol 4-phosphate-forming) [Sphaerotilus hippei]
MAPDLLIGIDAGTSVIKAVAFDLGGRQIAVASTPNRVLHGPDGAAEQDLDGTWDDTAATLRALAGQVPQLAARTLALAATAQGDGTWLIDADGRPVGPAMLWLDGRSAPQVQALRASPAGAAIAARTGTALNPSMQSGHLLWLQAHQPQRLARATTAMHCKDWLHFKATGQRATCRAEGVFTFGDHRSGSYDPEVLELLGLAAWRHLLPPMQDGIGPASPLSAAAAAQTGLRAGTPVVLPVMDVPATLLGGGGVAFDARGLRRVGCSILGSTGMHGWVAEGLEAIRPSAEAGYTMMMPLPDVRARLMSHMAATLNIDWLIGLLGEAAMLAGAASPSKAALLARLNDLVLETAPAQALYHPYIADNGERGPFVDPCARAQLSGFSTRLGLPGLARAVFEGITLAARDCYAALGPMPEEIRLSGGAARSPALRQLLASVTGVPVRVSHREECGAAAAAMCAAIALGVHHDVREALPTWVDACLDERLTRPDAQQTALYDQLFPVYRALAERSRAPWQDLARLRSAQRTAATSPHPNHDQG